MNSIEDVFKSLINTLIDGINWVIEQPFKGYRPSTKTSPKIFLQHRTFEIKSNNHSTIGPNKSTSEVTALNIDVIKTPNSCQKPASTNLLKESYIKSTIYNNVSPNDANTSGSTPVINCEKLSISMLIPSSNLENTTEATLLNSPNPKPISSKNSMTAVHKQPLFHMLV